MRMIGWLGLAALAFTVGGAAQAETVKVGVVLPFSGANADLGHQIDKAFDLYVKLHANDIAPNKVEIIKRDEGPPTGAVAKTVATELITNDKVQILTGFVFSPSAIALAPVVTQAKVPMVIANAGTAWITNLSPYIARLSFSMWHHGYPMGAYAHDKIGCKTAAVAYTDFPPGKDSTEAFKTGFEKAGGKITDFDPDGQPGAGAGLHAVLHEGEGCQARLHVRLHSVRRARDRRNEGLWRARHAQGRRQAHRPDGPDPRQQAAGHG